MSRVTIERPVTEQVEVVRCDKCGRTEPPGLRSVQMLVAPEGWLIVSRLTRDGGAERWDYCSLSCAVAGLGTQESASGG